jgi:hypothetical protein
VTEVLTPAQELSRRGFYVVKGAITKSTISSWKVMLRAYIDDPAKAVRFYVRPYADTCVLPWGRWTPGFLIANGWPMKELEALGFQDLKLHYYWGTLQPPGAAGMPWVRSEPEWLSPGGPDAPREVVAYYYLNPATHENGCMRVIPGSHRWTRDRALSYLSPTNSYYLSREVGVIVDPGDMLVMDSRLLNASHPNTTRAPSLRVAVSYIPGFDAQAPDHQNSIAGGFKPAPEAIGAALQRPGSIAWGAGRLVAGESF